MVEWNSLENCRALTGTVGSNPTLSAKTIFYRADPSDRDLVATRLPKKLLTKKQRFRSLFFVYFNLLSKLVFYLYTLFLISD